MDEIILELAASYPFLPEDVRKLCNYIKREMPSSSTESIKIAARVLLRHASSRSIGINELLESFSPKK